MDSRAKQRLTGAVILVALFVLLVPELLRGPKNGAPPAETADEEGMRSYTIDLDAPAGSAQPMSAPASAPPVVLPPVAQNPASGTERAVPGETARVETPAPAPAPATPVVTPMAATRETTNPAPAASLPRPTAAPVASTPPATTKPSAPAAVPKGSFVVQLGSFGSKDNADRLVRDMTAKGFNAFVAPITSGGRELYRVRVGPTRDRASAEALAAQLRRMGQTGSIVPIS
jgi:DedD protein